MKNFYKKIFAFILYYSGINCLCSLFLRNRLFILNYHSVSDEKNLSVFSGNLYENLSVTVTQFEEQINFLKKQGHFFMTFRDLDNVKARDIKKPTILYFDDGFKDIFANALPVLQKHNIPAVIFAPTGLADRTDFLWTLKYRYFLLNKGLSLANVDKLIGDFKNISDAEKDVHLEKIYSGEIFSFDYSKQNIFLNWDEIKKLSERGWEIGSHGVTHKRLTECADEDLRYEIFQSKTIIENKLNTTVKSFSYPYGRNDERVNNGLKKAGYINAVSLGSGLNNISSLNENFNALKSVGIKPHVKFYEFAVKLYANNFLRNL